MTAATRCDRVRTFQRETGARQVVEIGQPPRVARMAGSTIFPKRTAVCIVFEMAVHAFLRRIVETIGVMAGFAGGDGVQAGERETR